MSSSLRQRFLAMVPTTESAPPVEDKTKPAAVADNAADAEGKTDSAVQSAEPESSNKTGLPAEPVKNVEDAVGSSSDEGDQKAVVPAVEPTTPKSATVESESLPTSAVTDVAAKVDSSTDEGDQKPVVDAVEPAEPKSVGVESTNGGGLPATPPKDPSDAVGFAADVEEAHGVPAVQPAVPKSDSDSASGLPTEPVKDVEGKVGSSTDEGDQKPVADAVRGAKAHTVSATEDLDPMAAQMEPARVITPTEDHVRETEEAYRVLEAEAMGKGLEELCLVVEKLHHLKASIESANAAGGLSSESAYFAAFGTQALVKRLGQDASTEVASFESAVSNPAGKTEVSVEPLTATLEGIDAPFKTFVKRFVATSQRLLVPTWTALKMSASGLSKLSEQASKVKAQPDATIKVPGNRIALGKAPSKDVPGDLKKAAVWLTYLVGKFSKQAALDYKANVDLIQRQFNQVSETTGVESAMKAILSGWHDPRAKLGGKASDPIIGNYVFFKDQELKYKGESAAAKGFDELANHAFPEVLGFQDHDEYVSSARVDIPALSPSDIADLAKAFETAAAGAKGFAAAWETIKSAGTFVAAGSGGFAAAGAWPVWVASLGVLFAKTMHRIGDLNSEPYKGYLADDVRMVYDALVTSRRMTLHVGYDAMRVLRKEIVLFKMLAKKSLRVHLNAGKESFDQATATDGVSVNETAANEPLQVPAEGNLVKAGEVLPKQETFQDQPGSFQTIEDECSMESLIQEAGELEIVLKHYGLEAEGSEGSEKEAWHKRAASKVLEWWRKFLTFLKKICERIMELFGSGKKKMAELAGKVRHMASPTYRLMLGDDGAAWLNGMKVPDFDPYLKDMGTYSAAIEKIFELSLKHFNQDGRSDFEGDMKQVVAGMESIQKLSGLIVPAKELPGAVKLIITVDDMGEPLGDVSFEEQERPKVTIDQRYLEVKKVDLLAFLDKVKSVSAHLEDVGARNLKTLNDTIQSLEQAIRKTPSMEVPFTSSMQHILHVGNVFNRGMDVIKRWEYHVGKIVENAIAANEKKKKPATESYPLPYWYQANA